MTVAMVLMIEITGLTGCSRKGGETVETATPDTDTTIIGFKEAGVDAKGGDVSKRPKGIQPGTVFNYWQTHDLPAQTACMDNRANALVAQVYDNLLYEHHANMYDIRGNLAESWTVSDDGLIWVFKIRQDARFSSGNPVNAEAFVKTWDAVRQYQPRFFAPVEKYEATGEYELTVTLHSPSATFIYDLPLQAYTAPMDPVALEKYGPEDNRAAIGAGPYMISEYIAGERITLKANPYYNKPERQPCIETINMVVIPDENTALVATINGDLDAMNTVQIEVYNTLKANGWDVKLVEDRVNPFWFNPRQNPLFKDAVVREALCHMINWQEISNLVYDGIFPAPNSYWVGPGQVPYGDNYTYDPELGVKMLEEAGYKKDDIRFIMLADPDFTNLEVAIQGQFQALGFNNIETVTYDGATCYGMLRGGTYEVFPVHDGYSPKVPLASYTMGLIPSGTQRVMWLEYMDEEKYQEALEYYNTANTAPNFEIHVENVEKITRICQDLNSALGGVQVTRMFAVNDRFAGLYLAPVIGIFEFCYLWDIQAQ
jgi:ABC-type transport system substrate-binding protein